MWLRTAVLRKLISLPLLHEVAEASFSAKFFISPVHEVAEMNSFPPKSCKNKLSARSNQPKSV